MGWVFAVVPVAMAVLIVYVLVQGRRQRRARDRWNTGLCLKCGYDLQATVAICPECGLPVSERVDPAKIRETMTPEAFFDPPEVTLMDPVIVFETWQEFEATLICRYLTLAGIPADEVPFVDKRFATLLAYRVRVERGHLAVADEAKARILKARPGTTGQAS